MDFYGPFALTRAMIDLIVTRSLPGVALLCDGNKCVHLVSRSDHDVAEVLQQWIGRLQYFVFCYTESGSHAERLQMQLVHSLNLPITWSEYLSSSEHRNHLKLCSGAGTCLLSSGGSGGNVRH